jgi:hypothetical protein
MLEDEIEKKSKEDALRDGDETCVLHLLYRLSMLERGPFFAVSKYEEGDPVKEDADFFLDLERRFLLPENFLDSKFAFPNIGAKINEAERRSFAERLWKLVKKNAEAFWGHFENLQDHMKNAPSLGDQEKASLVSLAAEKVFPFFENSPNEGLRSVEGIIFEIRAIISAMGEYGNAGVLDLNPSTASSKQGRKRPPGMNVIMRDAEIQRWKEIDRSLRGTFFSHMREYMMDLIIYYKFLEKLIEEGCCEKCDEDFLPELKVHRETLQNCVYVPIQSLAIAKTGHDGEKGCFRKTAVSPYFRHEAKVVLGLIRNVVFPRMRSQKQEKEQINFGLMLFIAALHDLPEDTAMKRPLLLKKAIGRINSYDMSLLQVFSKREDIESKKSLHIIDEDDLEVADGTLRILSNNTKFSEEERTKVFQGSFCDESLIVDYLGDSKNPQQSFDFGLTKKEIFKLFPQEHHGGKLTQLLIKFNFLDVPEKSKEFVFSIKNQDRISNINRSKKMPVDVRFETLRETVTRLIAWQVFHHDHERYPVEDTLAILIDTTIDAYTTLKMHYPEKFTSQDARYLDFLLIWKKDCWKRGLIRDEFMGEDFFEDERGASRANILSTVSSSE